MSRFPSKKYSKYASYSILLSGVGLFCFIGFFRPGMLRKQTNLGHRLGGDVFTEQCENTLAVFRRSIAEIEDQTEFRYSECDLRETADHQIVVFHDWDLKKLVPDNASNRRALDGTTVGAQKICDLTLDQVKALRLHDGQEIPTLEEVLETALELKLKKPLLLEVKFFHSDKGRQAAIEIAKKFRDQADFEINFSAFRRNLKRSFPEATTWRHRFQDAGFRIYQVYRPISHHHDLCENGW